MMNRFLALAFALGVLAFPASARAGTPMDNAFNRLERAFKKLNDALAAPEESQRDACLALADKIRLEAVKARELDPKMTSSLPEAERATFLEKFRHEMDQFIGNIDTLIAAIKESRWTDARAAMDTLKQDKRTGHKAFRVKK